MKKLLISLLVPVVFAASCGQNGTVSSPDPAGYSPEAVLYNDWDRAVRIDVDMQNMYVSTPTKIEKPIDLYMSMALALKYNYTRRLITYEDSIIRAGRSPVNRLPEIVSHAGYINDTNSSMSPDLKVAWNMLDISMVYCLSQDKEYKASVAFEESRKVIHNILQETRTLYWKTLTAQRLLPVIDDMTEFMTLEVDDMNAKAKELEQKGETPEVAQLVKKRQYMEAIKNLSALKIGKVVCVACKKPHVCDVFVFDFFCGEEQNVEIFLRGKKVYVRVELCRFGDKPSLSAPYFRVHGIVVVKQLFLCFYFFKIVYNKLRARIKSVVTVLFLSHSHGEIPRFLRSFPAYHSGNAAITQEKNEVFPSAKRNLPQELRYIVRNESILAKNVTKLEIISNEMIFLLQNAGELHIIAPLRENKEGIPCLS